MARKATWQSHAGPTRAPAWHGGDTWLLFIFIIYRIYNIYRSSDYRKTNLLTLITASPFKPRVSPLFLPCGTMFHTFCSKCKLRGSTLGVGSNVHWKSARRSRGCADHRSLIAHVSLKRSYNGPDFTRSNASEALDRDPMDAFSRVS